MRFLALNECYPRALLVVPAIVANPRLPQHLMAKPILVALHLAAKRVLGVSLASSDLKPVRGGSHADNRSAAFEVRVQVFHLFVRQILEPQKHNRQVRRFQSFEAGNV